MPSSQIQSFGVLLVVTGPAFALVCPPPTTVALPAQLPSAFFPTASAVKSPLSCSSSWAVPEYWRSGVISTHGYIGCKSFTSLHASSQEGDPSVPPPASTPGSVATSAATQGSPGDAAQGGRGSALDALLRPLKSFFSGDKLNREKLGKLGMAALLSYGWVSNVSYALCISVAWFISSRRSGLSPLSAGQWQYFLGVYAGMFALNNILRPARFALSVGIAPFFDRVVATLMKRTRMSKWWAFGTVVFLVNVLGTFSILGAGISVASLLAGVPIWPK